MEYKRMFYLKDIEEISRNYNERLSLAKYTLGSDHTDDDKVREWLAKDEYSKILAELMLLWIETSKRAIKEGNNQKEAWHICSRAVAVRQDEMARAGRFEQARIEMIDKDNL